MDFLALFKAAASDSGIVAGFNNVATLAGVSGRPAQLAGWVRDAWIDIQNERNDWTWMRRRFGPVALTPSVNLYLAAELGVTRLGQWLGDRPGYRTFTVYDPDRGPASETDMEQISYDRWIERWGRGAHDSQMPREWAISPARELLLGPTPDKAYLLKGEYRASAQILSADADTPEMPEEYHRVIIPRAIRLAASSDEAWQPLIDKTNQYSELRNALVRDQTPPFNFM
ncbi:hypothetical protein [Sphingobium yanoikuyae]|uniref:hypothetical protein n=1 Tax=Sphingobium yanoikuyae TaxID=13690 RepID=UPI0035C6FFD5